MVRMGVAGSIPAGGSTPNQQLGQERMASDGVILLADAVHLTLARSDQSVATIAAEGRYRR
jgi:hypothetical protein